MRSYLCPQMRENVVHTTVNLKNKGPKNQSDCEMKDAEASVLSII